MWGFTFPLAYNDPLRKLIHSCFVQTRGRRTNNFLQKIQSLLPTLFIYLFIYLFILHNLFGAQSSVQERISEELKVI